MIRKRSKLKKYRKVYFLPEKDGRMKERSEMLMSELLTNFKDDILAESMEGRRRYQMITNEDGTVSFVDVTEYEQIGSEFGQAEVNAIHREINRKFDSGDVVDPLAAEESGFAADAKLTGDALREVSVNLNKVRVYVGSDGKIHFVNSAGADSALPFKRDFQVTVTTSSKLYQANNLSLIWGTATTVGIYTYKNGTGTFKVTSSQKADAYPKSSDSSSTTSWHASAPTITFSNFKFL